jgi:hypothetical protein
MINSAESMIKVRRPEEMSKLTLYLRKKIIIPLFLGKLEVW